MAYPTAKSNDREGGSPSKAESERTSDYIESTENNETGSVGGYVDRNHPHKDAKDRKTGNHPHQDLARK
jgi:hypothetical protein